MSKPTSFLVPLATAILGIAGSATSADAAVAYWSFQTTAAGGAGTLAVSEYNGFAAAPTLVTNVGTGSNTVSDTTATGGIAYTAPLSQTVYAGGAIGSGSNTTGFSMAWSTTQTTGASITGAFFTVSLNMLGLTDLTMAFDVRAASSSGSFPAPSSISSIQYSLDNGQTWNATGISSSTWSSGASTNWSHQTINLAGVDAIEGQSNVQLKFTLANSAVPTSAVNMNVKIDNLQLSAVPEPASAMLFGGAALVSMMVRRRK